MRNTHAFSAAAAFSAAVKEGFFALDACLPPSSPSSGFDDLLRVRRRFFLLDLASPLASFFGVPVLPPRFEFFFELLLPDRSESSLPPAGSALLERALLDFFFDLFFAFFLEDAASERSWPSSG